MSEGIAFLECAMGDGTLLETQSELSEFKFTRIGSDYYYYLRTKYL